MENTERESVTIELPADLRRWLKIQSAERALSQSEIVRDLLASERARRARKAAR